MSATTEYPRFDAGDGIKRFADSKLQESIRAAVSGLAEGHDFAVIGFANTQGEQRLAAVKRIGKDWSAVGVLEHSKGEKWRGEAAVVWSPGKN